MGPIRKRPHLLLPIHDGFGIPLISVLIQFLAVTANPGQHTVFASHGHVGFRRHGPVIGQATRIFGRGSAQPTQGLFKRILPIGRRLKGQTCRDGRRSRRALQKVTARQGIR